MKRYLAGACALALAAFASYADAATFKPIARGKSLVMTGKIEFGDVDRLEAAYLASCRKRNYCPERVFLNSEGGFVRPSIEIGSFIHEMKLDTVVGKTDVCASACFFVWAAGKTRVFRPTSVIGVHMIYDADTGKQAADATLAIVKFLHDIGVPNTIIVKFSTTPPEEMAWLTSEDVMGWAQELK